MGACETWFSTEFGIGSITLSYIYKNDLSLSMRKLAKPIIFADDMSIITSTTNPEGLKNNIN